MWWLHSFWSSWRKLVIYYQFQSGFSTGFSTKMAWVDWRLAPHQRQGDSPGPLDHGIFLEKFYWIQCHSEPVPKSAIGDLGSAPWQLSCRVPQGSILSPMLFNNCPLKSNSNSSTTLFLLAFLYKWWHRSFCRSTKYLLFSACPFGNNHFEKILLKCPDFLCGENRKSHLHYLPTHTHIQAMAPPSSFFIKVPHLGDYRGQLDWKK